MRQQKTTITAHQSHFRINFKELYDYRYLWWMLAYRDFKVRYAQSWLGFLWAFIQPILMLLVLSFVFGTVAQVETNGVPHLVFTIAGMCGWTYFSSLFSEAGNAIIANQQMVKKIYFPRLIIPFSKAITAFIDFLMVLLCLAFLLFWYQIPVGSSMLFLPFFILMAVVCGLTGGIWMSALTIRFRDFKHISPFIIQIGMYATPIAYPLSAVPTAYQNFFYLNPLTGVVEGIRWCILGGQAPSLAVGITFILILLLLLAGIFYFHKMEDVIADIL